MERERHRPTPPCSPLSRRRRALGPRVQAFAPGDRGSQRGRCSTARVSQNQPGKSGWGRDEGAVGQATVSTFIFARSLQTRRRAEALARSYPQTALQTIRAVTSKDLGGDRRTRDDIFHGRKAQGTFQFRALALGPNRKA